MYTDRIINRRLSEEERRQYKRNLQILWRAKDNWDAWQRVRAVGRFNRQVLQNQQWTSEELEVMERENRDPITHNIILQISNNIVGQYLKNKGQFVAIARKINAAAEGEILSQGLERVYEINKDKAKDITNFQMLLCYGFAVSRVDFGYRSEMDRSDAIIQNVNPNNVFMSPVLEENDIEKIDMIGQICEDTIDGIIVNFANVGSKGSKEKAEEILNEYGYCKDDKTLNRWYSTLSKELGFTQEQDAHNVTNVDFFYTDANNNRCRYFEIWTKERRLITRYHDYLTGEKGVTDMSLKEIAEINNKRIQQTIEEELDEQEVKQIEAEQRYEWIWRVRYLTPNGYCLMEMDSPFAFQSHPYSVCFYNILDGKIQPLLSHVTPLQRALNKMWMIAMFQLGHASKGMVLYDKTLLNDSNVNEEEFMQAWSSFDKALGLNVPEGRNIGELVHQFYSQVNITPVIGLFNQVVAEVQTITGVNSAIQGQRPDNGTPASRYQMETDNAMLNSAPIMDCFGDFRKDKYKKVAKLLLQYYDEEDWRLVSDSKNIEYRDDVANMDYDVTITQEITTSNYAITEDDKLFNLTTQGMITPQMYFELSHAGYAKKALELIKKQQEEAEKQQQQMMQQQQQMMQQQQQQPVQAQMPAPEEMQMQVNAQQEQQPMYEQPQQQEYEQAEQPMSEEPMSEEQENEYLLQQLLAQQQQQGE